MRADPEIIRAQPIDRDHADKPLYSSTPMPHYMFHIEIACGAGRIGPSRAQPSPHRRRVPPFRPPPGLPLVRILERPGHSESPSRRPRLFRSRVCPSAVLSIDPPSNAQIQGESFAHPAPEDVAVFSFRGTGTDRPTAARDSSLVR
jgi:hypothetical protein